MYLTTTAPSTGFQQPPANNPPDYREHPDACHRLSALGTASGGGTTDNPTYRTASSSSTGYPADGDQLQTSGTASDGDTIATDSLPASGIRSISRNHQEVNLTTAAPSTRCQPPPANTHPNYCEHPDADDQLPASETASGSSTMDNPTYRTTSSSSTGYPDDSDQLQASDTASGGDTIANPTYGTARTSSTGDCTEVLDDGVTDLLSTRLGSSGSYRRSSASGESVSSTSEVYSPSGSFHRSSSTDGVPSKSVELSRASSTRSESVTTPEDSTPRGRCDDVSIEDAATSLPKWTVRLRADVMLSIFGLRML